MDERVEPNREQQAVELAVFLFLIVPSIVLSLFTLPAIGAGFVLVAVSTIFRDLALVLLVFYFLWRNGEPSSRIGWTADGLFSNLLLGILLFPFVTVGAAMLDNLLRSLGLSGPPRPPSFLSPHGTAEMALAVILVVIVAISEETIFRGYLIARLNGIADSIPLAVLLSSVLFAAGHGYEGTSGLVSVGAMGFIFALLFVWRKSLVAPMVIHFLNNLLAIVLLPMLGSG